MRMLELRMTYERNNKLYNRSTVRTYIYVWMYVCMHVLSYVPHTHIQSDCVLWCAMRVVERDSYINKTQISVQNFYCVELRTTCFFSYFRQIHSYVSYCRWYVVYKWWWYCGRCFGYISLVFCSSSSSLYISSFFFCIHICWLLLMLRLFLFLYFKSTNWIKFFRPIDVCVCNYDIMKKTSKNGTQNSVKGYPYT